MRNMLLYTVAACGLLLMGCKHKPTAQELAAARADSIANVIKNIKQGFPVHDLLSLPDVKWAVITASGDLSADTLILAASVGGKVCLTNIRGTGGEWQNVKDGYLPVEDNHIQLARANIGSNAAVDMVLNGSLIEVAKRYANRQKAQEQAIKGFIVKFFSSTEEDRKRMMTENAKSRLETASSYGFCIDGGLNGLGGIGEIYPQTIKLKCFDKNTGRADFTQEVKVVGFQAGEVVYSKREVEEYSLWLKDENGSLLVNDIEAPFNDGRLSEY